jgi:hypothetical protein
MMTGVEVDNVTEGIAKLLLDEATGEMVSKK